MIAIEDFFLISKNLHYLFLECRIIPLGIITAWLRTTAPETK